MASAALATLVISGLVYDMAFSRFLLAYTQSLRIEFLCAGALEYERSFWQIRPCNYSSASYAFSDTGRMSESGCVQSFFVVLLMALTALATLLISGLVYIMVSPFPLKLRLDA
jgi:hypothetical protein